MHDSLRSSPGARLTEADIAALASAHRTHSPDMSGVFEQRLSDICGSIADVETRCSMSEARAQAAQARADEAELTALDYEERYECASHQL